MAVKFLDNLDLVGNQLQNVIIDVKSSAPASLGIGQLYMNIGASVGTLVIDKGPKGGPHGVLVKDLLDVVIPGNLQMVLGTAAKNYALTNSPITYQSTGWPSGGAFLELAANVSLKNDTLFDGDIIDGGGNTGTSGQLLSSKGTGGGVSWIDAPVSYTKWILTGDTGTQDITDGNTVVVAGGSNITTAVTATDTVTVNLDSTINIGTLNVLDPVQSSFAGQVTIPTTPVASTDAASKAYVDASAAGSGALIFQGGYDAATNTPDLDVSPSATIKTGWTYTVTSDGTFFTEQVRVGDVLIATKDQPNALNAWTTVQNNVDLASAAKVGIGNVVPGTSAGIDVTYSNGTATLELSSASLSKAAPALTDTVTYDKAGTNHASNISDIETLIGGGGGYVANSTGQTVHKFQHNLGTEYVMVEVLDFSDTPDRFNTVYATVTRPGPNDVWVYTASSADILVLIKKVQ